MKSSSKLFLLLFSFLFLGCGNAVLPPENYYVNCGDKIFHIGEELHFQNEELLNHHKRGMLNSLKRQMNITDENEKECLFFHTISELEELFASNIHFYLTATSKG